ncbi:MAG: hypothetical protein IT381_07455 [Deltaproteobacteria bacterium]|nr:hypothetical protein [Deltaproteobacteria bacterium]
MLFAAALFLAVPIDSEAVTAARTNYEKARYEDVVKSLRDADVSALEKNVLADALFMLGVSELALGNEALSQKALVRLFTEVPDFEWPLVAKKVVAALEKARKQVAIVLQPTVSDGGVRVCGAGLPKRAEMKIVFTTASGEEGGLGTADGACFMRAAPKDQPVNGYYVVAVVDGEQRATAGSRLQPLPYEDRKSGGGAVAEGTPWYKHWATWTIAGILVAGAIAGGVAGGVISARERADGTMRINVVVPPP